MTPPFLCRQAKAVVSRSKCRDTDIHWLELVVKLYSMFPKHLPTIAKDKNFRKIPKKLQNDPAAPLCVGQTYPIEKKVP